VTHLQNTAQSSAQPATSVAGRLGVARHPSVVSQLPIDSLLDELVALTTVNTRLVVEAPPGAGKTTRVPPALWQAGLWNGAIWIAEPRRLAAKLMAHRVAAELRQNVGELVGYTVRFDDCSSAKTKLRYITSGILLRRLLCDPNLSGVDCVILDEFHERHLETDLALALICSAQIRRPELRLLIMSATLETGRLAELLGGCPRLSSQGRLHPLEVEFETATDDRPLEKRVSSALRRMIQSSPLASTLIFLPGAAEIRRVQATIAPLCAQAEVDIAILHGDLSLDAQTKAILPGDRPRVVLTTNIAESSITVEGITGVIDSGLSRQKDCSTFSGMSRLTVQKISRASATQRAGRAGRTAPGRVIRLYTRGDFEARPEFDLPEILRLDFAEALLLLGGASLATHSAGRDSPSTSPSREVMPTTSERHTAAAHSLDELLLLDRPARAAVEVAQSLLRQLGATDNDGQLTRIGIRMLEIPLHPRLSRLLIECDARGVGDLGALVAALLSERDLRSRPRATFGVHHQNRRQVLSGDSDVVELIDLYLHARDAHLSNAELYDSGIDKLAFGAIQRTHQQLRRLIHGPDVGATLDESAEQELAIALLVAFPDRVAKRRTRDGAEVVLRSGAVARLSESSVVVKPQWLLAIDAEERRDSGRSPGSVVRIASAIKEDWLIDILPDGLTCEEELCWVNPPGRVEVRSRIRLGSLTVNESRHAARPGPKTLAVLLEVIEQSGLLQSDELVSLFARLELLSEFQNNGVLIADATVLRTAMLSELLRSRVDLDGLDGATLAASLFAQLPPAVVHGLRAEIPEVITLRTGRRCPVHYAVGRPPWIASKLQDFFGLASTPTILAGRQKLVVHLLAPNHRAVQITNDLHSFWVKQYPEIRRQLMRRYPRHPWPEDGLSATPPEPRPTQRRR
jgi:ATP-dependent helicase HrpB